jgi:hypothetical protein
MSTHESALDGRYQLVGDAVAGWTVVVDGQPRLMVPSRSDANHIFSLVLAAHEIGRSSAFSDIKTLIGAK